MDWKQIIGAVAPTVATALGGPLAGLAVDAIGKSLGMDQPTMKKVQEAFTASQLTADQIAQLKQAELTLTVRMRELDIQEESLSYADLDSARKMQISVHSQWPGILTFVTTVAVLSVIAARMYGLALPNDGTTTMLIGSLITGWGSAMAYWFGTTRSSADKNNLLAQSSPSAPIR